MPILQKYRQVVVRVFDVHTVVEPHLLAGSNYFQPAFSFLGDANMYNQQFVQAQPLLSPNLRLVPLPAALDKKNKFWSAYQRVILNKLSPWTLQIPFGVTLRHNPFHLRRDKGLLRGIFIHTQIYLNALGWSTQLNIHLRGNFTTTTLVGIIGRLAAGKGSANGLLMMNDKPLSLTEAFITVRDLLVGDVYASNSFQPAPPAYPRRFVISIHKFTGDKVISNGMLGVDRENFRKILYGGSVPNLSSNTGGSLGLQWTQVRKPYNFAVTDFEYGTLIFLQDDLSDKNKIKPPFCFSLNVRDMFVTVYSLYSFIRQAKAAPAGSRAAELRDNADAILHQLPDKYTNEVCKTLFLYHSGLAPYK